MTRPTLIALLALLSTSCSNDSNNRSAAPPGPTPPPAVVVECPSARLVSSESDLVPGPLARGRLGDFVLENKRLRAIVQKGGRNWYNISQFGGNIIDALPRNSAGALVGLDHFEEAVLGTNVESAPNYQTVEVISAGGTDNEGNCLPAVIRASGPDDLLDFVNGSSAIRDLGFSFPDSADDVDLPVQVQTDYILDPNAPFITMQTRLINDSSEDLEIYMVEYMNGSGEVELFQHGYGFGEPLVTGPCDSCRSAIYAGHEGGAGVSYGIVHNFAGTSSVSVSGVTVLVYGADATQLFAAGADAVPPNFTVPADGELEFNRWFVVAAGGVSGVRDVEYQILEQQTGTLAVAVRDTNGVPLAGAEISVITSDNDFQSIAIEPRGPDTLVANQLRTDAQGRAVAQLPPGDYELRANVPGRLAGENFTRNVSIVADEVSAEVFDAPLPARIRVRVIDENDQPVAAKVQLLGTDTSPDAGEPQNQESVLGGVLTVQTGIFGDANADPLAPGVLFAEFAVADAAETGPVTVGDTGVFEFEPGSYELSVSRGPRYSEHREQVTLTAGELTQITARVVRVVDTPNIVFGDFHVHSFDSPDSEVTNRERVASYLAEDMDFFTPSDHGMRVDFEPVIAAMNVSDRIASAPSAEITTFDYGHFNAWPVAIDTSPANTDEASQSADGKISQGSVDWGRPAPVGEDFPSRGNYGLSPAELLADADSEPFEDGRNVVTQINHVDGHFGAAGLQIDTGQTPPQSLKAPESKRLNPAISNAFSDDFDSLELWIGVDGREHQLEKFLGENMGDWFNMLNQGILRTLIANSDTHERRLTSLSTRNWVSVPAAGLTEDGRADLQVLRSDPHLLGDSVIAGASIGSNSLFIQPKLSNVAGDQAGLEVTDAFGLKTQPLPLASPDEATTLALNIQAPLWAQYDQVEVFVNGATVRHTDQLMQPTNPPRYALCDAGTVLQLGTDFSRDTVEVASIGGTTYSRYESSLEVPISSPGTDFWMVVMVRGTDGNSAPLWPVVPNDFSDSGDGLATRSADDEGTVAMAVSNPIFVDADGDGRWTPPGVQTHSGSLLDSCP